MAKNKNRTRPKARKSQQRRKHNISPEYFRESPKETLKIAKKKSRDTISLTDIKARLSGSRFRYLNEQLYSSTSTEAWKLYNDDNSLFNAYHYGYRHQVSQWPYNPLSKVIKWLKKHSEYNVIGDFGCGDALVAKTFTKRTVHSFDLVSTDPSVTACNMLHVPLSDNTLDVAIFCLSLMGKDWPLFILEASRCLKLGGVLKIVEVKSRLENAQSFSKFIESYGYKYSRDENTKVV